MVLLKASALAVSLWLARSLPVSEYGRFGIYYAIQTGLGAFGAVGIIESVISLLGSCQSREERVSLFRSANTVFLVTATLAVVGSRVLLWFSGMGGSNGTIWGMGGALASGILLSFTNLQAQIVRLDERHIASLALATGVPFVGLVGGVIGVLLKGTIEAFFMGGAVGMALSLWFLVAARCVMFGHIRRRGWVPEILHLLPPYVLITLFGWLSGYGNNFIVNELFQREEVARFTFALSVGGVMQLTASAMNQVWSPRFYHLTFVQPLDVVEQKNHKFFFGMALCLGLLAAGCLAALRPILLALGGSFSVYASMSIELFWILGAYVVTVPSWHCQNYLLAHGKSAELMRVTLVTGVIGIAAWVLLMWALGPIGIYVGFFLQTAVRSVGYVVTTRKFWPIQVAWTGVGAGILLTIAGLGLARSLG
jgi:O-antigen/teichoic acid export membrane protein